MNNDVEPVDSFQQFRFLANFSHGAAKLVLYFHHFFSDKDISCKSKRQILLLQIVENVEGIVVKQMIVLQAMVKIT